MTTLRQIAEESGSLPTAVQQDDAVQTKRAQQGFEPLPPGATGLAAGRTGGVSEFGERVLASEGTVGMSTFEEEEQLPALTEPTPAPPRSNSIALDQAASEQLMQGEGTPMEQRIQNNTYAEGAFDSTAPTVGDEFIQFYKDQYEAAMFEEDGALAFLQHPDTSPEKKVEAMQRMLKQINLHKATQRQVILYGLMLNGGQANAAASIDPTEQSFTVPQIIGIREDFIKQQNKASIKLATDYVASLSFDFNAKAVASIAVQELLPIYNVGSKHFLNQEIMSAIGIPDSEQPGFWLGEQERHIADTLISMSPLEREEAIGAIVSRVAALQTDPLWGPILTDMNTLERFETLMDPKILNGHETTSELNRWLRNFEAGAELLWAGFIVRNAGRVTGGWTGAFRAHEMALQANRIAREAGNHTMATRLGNAVRGKVAKEQGVDPDAVDMALDIPKPKELTDQRTINLPGELTDEVVRTTRIADRLKNNNKRQLFRVLGPEGRARTAANLEATLQLGDQAKVVPGMSVVDEMDDGVRITSLISKTGKAPYASLEDMIPDILALDPRLEIFTIVQRGVDGLIHEIPMDAEQFARIATGQQSMPAGHPALPDAFFLQWDHVRPYHPADKVAFMEQGYRSSVVPRFALTPNAKFEDDIYGSLQDAGLREARANKLTAKLLQTYDNLPLASKQAVTQAYEWSETFGKETGKQATDVDFLSEFPDLTPKERAGIISLRANYEVQYELQNHRLYQEFAALDYKTARPRNPDWPTYHGAALPQESVRKGAKVMDPETGEIVSLDAVAIEAIYNGGGGVMKLDIALDVTGSNGSIRSTHILMDGDNYTIGRLSTHPHEYYPNYQYRFYKTPYFINKVHKNVEIDGRIQDGGYIEAFRSAGSEQEAMGYLSRIADQVTDSEGITRWVDKSDKTTVYSFTPAHNMEQSDRVLAQKQSMHREGRLFWDARSQVILPDVNNNPSPIWDFSSALEKGNRLAARQNASEDVMRALKEAFNNTYASGPDRLLKATDIQTKGLSAVIEDLKTQLGKTADPSDKRRIKTAIERAKYLRQTDGIESGATPWMRRGLLSIFQGADRFINSPALTSTRLGKAQEWAQRADPIQSMKTATFGMFMVLRPPKQLFLQMSQPLYLSGIDPAYIISGKGLVDATALKFGNWRFHKADFDPGYSNKVLAKAMGLKQDEFLILLNKLDEGAHVDIINDHSFSGGSAAWRRKRLPKVGNAGSLAWYGIKAGTNMTLDGLKKAGFETGEALNKIATFNIAWRQVMREKGYTSLKQLTDDDWRKVHDDTENLSLAMSPANAASYQRGNWSLATQFIAFSHKSLLFFLGKNPALREGQLKKVWFYSAGLFGAGALGMREELQGWIRGMGLVEKFNTVIPGEHGGTMADILIEGAIQTTANLTLKALNQQAVDMTNFSPIPNITQFWEMNVEQIMKDPGMALLGPFGTRLRGTMNTFDFVRSTVVSDVEEAAGESLLQIMDQAARNILPQWSDITAAKLAYESTRMYAASGEHLEISPNSFNVFLRGLIGIRTTEETTMWSLRDQLYSENETFRAGVKDMQKYLTQTITMYNQGDISEEEFKSRGRGAWRLAKYLTKNPEQARLMMEAVWSKDFFELSNPEDLPINALMGMLEEGLLTRGRALGALDKLNINPAERQEAINAIGQIFDDRLRSEAELEELTKKARP